MSFSDNARTRAAANSMASGIPSRRRQISRTMAALSSLRAKSGRTLRARSVNSSMASSASDSEGTRQVTSPGTPIGSRLVASRVNPVQMPSRATMRGAQLSRRCSQLSNTTNIRRSPMKLVTVSSVEWPG
jgi:hypothetical protein